MGTRLDQRLYIFFAFTTFFVLNDARHPVQLSLPPFELLAPLPLPENIPPYCANHPPFAPQPPSTAVPTPPGYSPSPPSHKFPIRSPPTYMPTPKPSGPPPQYEPTPPYHGPCSHPKNAPTPPFHQPPTVHPPPVPVPIQSPPPSPPTYMPTPEPPGPLPQYQPSPPYRGPCSPPKNVPTPPFHQPPTVHPPPVPAPPPPHKKPPHAVWCVAKPTVPDAILQEALDYACGFGSDCKSIQPNGPCFQPNTLLAHASYAFNSYWQNTKLAGGTCDFGGTAMLVTVDPSYNDCYFVNN